MRENNRYPRIRDLRENMDLTKPKWQSFLICPKQDILNTKQAKMTSQQQF